MLTDQPTSGISIIIPTLNEGPRLKATLRRLPTWPETEIIVVDGGSSDATAAIAKSSGARVLTAATGRAVQMNAGAAFARGDILLFLHADTILPDNFIEPVRLGLAGKEVVAGAFRLAVDAPGRALRLVEWFANLRTTLLQLPYGDQALFMSRKHFAAIGGFPEQPFLEDLLMVRALRHRGTIAILPLAATTSARRWQRLGVLQTTLRNQMILCGYLAGISPARLARWYRH